MSATETVCPGCSRGCNMYVWVRNNEILRQTPRFNPDVNDYWMCDRGRLETFRQVNAETRLKSPHDARRIGSLWKSGWDEAIARAASELKTFRKSESGRARLRATRRTRTSSSCRNSPARSSGHQAVGVPDRMWIPGDEDELLIRADKTPNSRGGGDWASSGRPARRSRRSSAAIRDGQIKALLRDRRQYRRRPGSRAASCQAGLSGRPCSQRERDDPRWPTSCCRRSTFAEKNGTFTNFQGRVQRIRPAVAHAGAGPRAGRVRDEPARQVRDAVRPLEPGSAKRDARPAGRSVAGSHHSWGSNSGILPQRMSSRSWLPTVGAFKGMTYRQDRGLGRRSWPDVRPHRHRTSWPDLGRTGHGIPDHLS